MKIRRFFYTFAFLGTMCILQGCGRSSNDVWEDTKSAGRHMKRGIYALGGKHEHSRQITCPEDFTRIHDEEGDDEGDIENYNYQSNNATAYSIPQDFYSPAGSYSTSDNYAENLDFIPLDDPTNELALAGTMARPPHETPGEQGSSIPGIQAFHDPSTHPRLAKIFRPIYFDYDSNLVKGQQNLQIIRDIADFLRSHPNMYVFIEGHTDERGAQAYNLPLGSRRANAVRNLLLSEGISPDRLFTISYGKEHPVILESHEEGWAKNRRSEFKIYER